MLVLATSLAQDRGFPYSMLGIYATSAGLPIVITSDRRANTLFNDKLVQFRDIREQDDHSLKGEAFSGSWLLLGPVGHTPDNLIGAAIDYVGNTARGAQATTLSRSGSISVKLWTRTTLSNLTGFDFVWTSLSGRQEIADTAKRAGDLEDIMIAGTYADKADDISVVIKREHDGEGTDKLSGTMTWKGTVFVFTGRRGITHCIWSATEQGKTSKAGEGFFEWAPTPAAIPARGKPWKSTDRIYMLVEKGTFGLTSQAAYYLTVNN